jgi:type IX secretion system PorP/SprF family membrane protein
MVLNFLQPRFLNKKSIILLVFIHLLISLVGNCQQIINYNSYYLNTYLINPAYAGKSGYTDAMLIYKKNWIGMPDAPQSFLATIDFPILADKGGLALLLNNEQSNVISRTSAYSSFAYRIRLSNKQRLSMGASLGLISVGIDFDKIRAKSLTDATLLQYPAQKALLDGNIGIAYQYNHFRVGFSIYQFGQTAGLFSNDYDNRYLTYSLVRHYNLLLEYSYELNNQFRLNPMLLLRSVQGSGLWADFNTTLYFKKQYWVNISYRFKDALGFGAGFVLDRRYAFSYQYELPAFNEFGQTNQGTHEICLKFRFVKPQDKSKTGYEFIDNTINYTDFGKYEEEKAKKAIPLPKKYQPTENTKP